MHVNTHRRSAQIHLLGAIKSSGGTERLTEERNSAHACVCGDRSGGPMNRATGESGQAVRKKTRKERKNCWQTANFTCRWRRKNTAAPAQTVNVTVASRTGEGVCVRGLDRWKWETRACAGEEDAKMMHVQSRVRVDNWMHLWGRYKCRDACSTVCKATLTSVLASDSKQWLAQDSAEISPEQKPRYVSHAVQYRGQT